MTIDILLSTYDGELYLEELLQSIEGQSYPDWKLIIRDDGSTDKTPEILKLSGEEKKDKITIVSDREKHLGPKKSYETLLEHSTADYIMFCDQDDVWMKDKIQLTLEKMKAVEEHNPELPVMVFTDLSVTDKDLNILHPSLWKYTRVNPENINNIYRLLVNNPVVGCTVMINKAVKPLVLPIPEKAVMHDWWIALNVASKGKVGFVSEPTIRYRIHGRNNLGVSKANVKYYIKRILQFSTTFLQNLNAVSMLKSLDFKLSVVKFLGYKFVISFSKIFQ